VGRLSSHYRTKKGRETTERHPSPEPSSYAHDLTCSHPSKHKLTRKQAICFSTFTNTLMSVSTSRHNFSVVTATGACLCEPEALDLDLPKVQVKHRHNDLLLEQAKDMHRASLASACRGTSMHHQLHHASDFYLTSTRDQANFPATVHTQAGKRHHD